jgi:CubicO group peptidase (beta-lactamase class C family)/D-alanyl-D-alanine dipeptidase
MSWHGRRCRPCASWGIASPDGKSQEGIRVRSLESTPTARACLRWRALLACVMLAVAATVDAAEPASLRGERDAAFDATFERYKLPGLAVGVVRDGQVVYLRTAGERVAGDGEKIDADTLFKIASNSKAMTAGVLARLVDAGKLDWDDPVTKHLPQFRMHDPWVTQQMQVRDLLIHNSGLGLGAGDLMLWPEPNRFTRADIIAGLQHLKPTHSFRAHYAYDNLLYVVAGEVAAAAGGAPYETLVKRELFAPLGMRRCQVGGWNRVQVGNVAQPHMRTGAGNRVIREDGEVVPDITSMAAGGIRCSLNDMLTWVGMWLSPDATPAWLSPAQRKAVWTAHMPMPVSARMRAWDNSHVSAYGYGWRLSDVDGAWKVAHTGTLAGMYSSVILLPDQRTGIVILINGEGEAARTALGEVLTKQITLPGQKHSVAHYAALLDEERAGERAAKPKPDTRHRAPAPVGALATWAGRYRDPWFGDVTLCAQGDRVRFSAERSPMLTGTVMQVDKRWLVDWDDDSVDAEPWLHFDAGSGTHRLTLSHVDPDADFSYDYQDLEFTRVAACDAAPAVKVEISSATDAATAGLVDVASLANGIQLDMRYAGPANFTGARVPGYEANTCLLLAPVAQALAKVQVDVQREGLSLKLFDCYRPVRSVKHFVAWARDTTDQRTRSAFYPNVEKAKLLDGYIAETSGHSRGATLDLTLTRCERGACVDLDMGTPFDFFDARANTAHADLSPAQKANRAHLVDAMARHGFHNYPMEWWHFTFRPEPSPQTAYDVPIR